MSESSSARTGTNHAQLVAALTALRDGDFSARVSEGSEGAAVFNDLAQMLGELDSELRRIARELGTEGRFGPQAEVSGTRGGWTTLVGDINMMAANLTNQLRDLARTTTAIAMGDFQQKVTVDGQGEIGELKATLNVMCDQFNQLAAETYRIAREIGTEGIFGGQAEVRGVSGSWKDITDGVNLMSLNLTNQFRNFAYVTKAVASGTSPAPKVAVDAEGEMGQFKEALNGYVDKINANNKADASG
jgi:HAMP domain-containing protein